ncbi:uncharacterized protein KY384_008431 [Bacidia gigantensis]|uniref:uncharacterized protein n=1 Tax=Bacidia gigantensis TaxID=2732470 RepID=UPI001D053208|nr:uncharacterized protein KY384_008431 [Bacidia gigantensis]KAG8527002.1 hypothetical protein KY384_008431 [Bacidia gigantensis]
MSQSDGFESDSGGSSKSSVDRRGRASKRQCLSTPDVDDETDYENEKSASDKSQDIASQPYRKDNEEDANEKPKSKYRIHIPKNPEFPKDAFFTQPPNRASSPYRIGQFNWQKPSIPRPSPKAQETTKIQSKSETLDIHHTSNNQGTVNGRASGNPASDLSKAETFDLDESDEDMLAQLPADAFEQSNSSHLNSVDVSDMRDNILKLAAPASNLKQTTLFGTQAQSAPSQTQSKRVHNWPMANREEPLTHHQIDLEAMKTWVYPTNLGTIRDYQYSIVARGLYHNMLVALPTGLGKTFIAATIMLNWFRWTLSAQIVFVAPTRPLVSQQVKACFEITGIPRSATTMLTGTIPPGLRTEEWRSKRVFFMTPQTLINDLKTGICDPKRMVLIVVDEAHRATGNYAYVEVVKFLKRFNSSFRVLALTATPGASIESVQEVIDGLGISRVEIRTEESFDIRQYVHPRKIDTVLFDNSDEMLMVMDLFSKALQPILDKLIGMNAYWSRDPMSLTPYGCTQARQRWFASDAGRKANPGLKSMVMTIFSLLASLSHATELLKFHGIGPFYHKVLGFRNQVHANGKGGGKYANQINGSQPFQTMMSRAQIWINTPDFVGHPKLEYVQSVALNHFLDAGEGRGSSDPASTRIMIFSHFRDSAEGIARILGRNTPMIRPHVFVGQSSTKESEGMDQKTQLDIIQKFQNGTYNTLVATSIGEEGLDIGEVDLIICYDASASPIRMLQRMGRTGRKRAGNITVTLMKGKEENSFIKAKDNYEKMQVEIASGARFNFHDEESRRIVPKDIHPAADKRIIDIPLENTQADLPEPTRRGRPPKRPPKKFNMPDGVRTGFVKASKIAGNSDSSTLGADDDIQWKTRASPPSPISVPLLTDVLLSSSEEKMFERKYLDVSGDASQVVEAPRMHTFPSLQRRLRPVKNIPHSHATDIATKAFDAMHMMTMERAASLKRQLKPQDCKIGEAQAVQRAVAIAACQRSTIPAKSKHRGSTIDLSSPAEQSSAVAVTKDRIDSDEIASDESLNAGDDDTLDGGGSSRSLPSLSLNDTVESTFLARQEALTCPDLDEELPGLATIFTGQKESSRSFGERRRVRRVVADDSDEG